MCKNMGASDKDVVWECTGYGLTPGYTLSHSDVSCEGYDYQNDPYILKGSCGVFYSVNEDLSYKNPTTTTTTTSTTFENKYSTHPDYYSTNSSGDFWTFIFLISIMILIIVALSNVDYSNRYWYYPGTWYNNYYYPTVTPYYVRPTTSYSTTTTTTTHNNNNSTSSTTSGNTRRR
jgi:hypothetical protein